jgi:hypothetical protein
MPDPKVSWRKFKNYSGPRILGSAPMEMPTNDHHVDRAYWLTAKVESGAKFGAIVMYDGTGLTGGPDQHIAVYPKHLADDDLTNDQGGLWTLMRRLEYTVGGHTVALEGIWDELRAHNCYLGQDGKLRYYQDVGDGVAAGDLVPGKLIREILTPGDRFASKVVGGAVPKTGLDWELSKRWALMFHRVLVHPDTHRAQVQFGIEHLVERTKKRRIKVEAGAWRPLESVGYGGREVTSLRVGDGWPEELDLALSVYQSHSVNAPGKANKILGRAWKDMPLRGSENPGQPERYARRLIKLLGTSSYGRWDDDLKTGRYQRTRSAARASGLWSRSLLRVQSQIPEPADHGTARAGMHVRFRPLR